MAKSQYKLESMKDRSPGVLLSSTVGKVTKPDIHVDDMCYHFNLFATDETRILSHTVVFNHVIMVPLALYSASLSFIVSCGAFPVTNQHFRFMAAAIWTVFLSVRIGVVWRSKVVMLWSIFANLGISSWSGLMLNEGISSDYLPRDSCSNNFWAFLISLLILPHLLTWKLGMYIRKILMHPEREPYYVRPARRRVHAKVNPRVAARQVTTENPKQEAPSNVASGDPSFREATVEAPRRETDDDEKPSEAKPQSDDTLSKPRGLSSVDEPRSQKDGQWDSGQDQSGTNPRSSASRKSVGHVVAFHPGPIDIKKGVSKPTRASSSVTTPESDVVNHQKTSSRRERDSIPYARGTAARPSAATSRWSAASKQRASISQAAGSRMSRADLLQKQEGNEKTQSKAAPAGSHTRQGSRSPPRKPRRK
eukprot:GEMP01032223.1.p1 GENE.GEMP01032223.1~~GEMP01032223.1.p1  ORF type:complete len:421 (+),score=53.28 GEMP01032223.1:187-1449(+)